MTCVFHDWQKPCRYVGRGHETLKINQIASQNVYFSKFSGGACPPGVFKDFIGLPNILGFATALKYDLKILNLGNFTCQMESFLDVNSSGCY